MSDSDDVSASMPHWFVSSILVCVINLSCEEFGGETGGLIFVDFVKPFSFFKIVFSDVANERFWLHCR